MNNGKCTISMVLTGESRAYRYVSDMLGQKCRNHYVSDTERLNSLQCHAIVTCSSVTTTSLYVCLMSVQVFMIRNLLCMFDSRVSPPGLIVYPCIVWLIRSKCFQGGVFPRSGCHPGSSCPSLRSILSPGL